MIARMSRRANGAVEVGPAAIAIAITIGLLYLYLGGALHSVHGPTTATVAQETTARPLPGQALDQPR